MPKSYKSVNLYSATIDISPSLNDDCNILFLTRYIEDSLKFMSVREKVIMC
jgi:hypothetical protein